MDGMADLVQDGATLSKALGIYLQLCDLSWPEPMIVEANKALHVAFEAPFSSDPSEMLTWSRETIKADFEALFAFMQLKYDEAKQAPPIAEEEPEEDSEI
jgi:hypothetical protein